MAPNDDQVREALASAVRYYTSRHTESPVVYVQEEGQWRIYADGKVIRESAGTIPSPMLTQSEEISQGQAERLIELGRAKAERSQADRAEAELAKRKQERQFTARLWRSPIVIIPVVVLLACMAGVSAYCYVGPVSIEEEALLSAEVFVLDDHEPIPIDLTDAAMREEIAKLLNGLHRWCGIPCDCAASVILHVKLRDGLAYHVSWYSHGALTLWIERVGPDEGTSMWVKSRDMNRFLAEYLGP